MKISELRKSRNVIYVPCHANGDINHQDCETGIISSWNNKFVFVRYYRHGSLQCTAKATDINNLIDWNENERKKNIYLKESK